MFKTEVNVNLIIPTILGTYFYFQMNKSFYKDTIELKTDESFDNYIQTDLTNHIQQTIKSLLLYDN